MSKLLEQAVIDAKALKEAALRNAEQLVIEKYSEEVREAVDHLLEQDLGAGMDMGFGDTDPLGGADPMAADPSFSDLDPLGADSQAPEGQNAEEDSETPIDVDSLLADLPDAFSSGDDEIINIKLDSLEADTPDDENGVFGGDDEYSEDEIGIDILDDIDFSDSEEDPEAEVNAETPSGPVDIDITSDMVKEALRDLGISEEEVDLEDIIEAVRVDFDPQKSGWAGTPEMIMREYEAMLLAREQDSEVKEKNEKLRKAVKNLKQENKTIVSAASKLQKQNKKYETAFNTLQEKLETMNVSNAKLLYINQALENASLNERQKRKIVEAISKAETVQEAKIIFDTMSDAVSTTSDVKKDSTLNEVVSRKSSLLVAARHEQTNKDANPLYNRMQKLAGIKTK